MILDPELTNGFRKHLSSEQLLMAAVVQTAVLDLFGRVGLTSNKEEASVMKHEAFTFLTAESGPWAARRAELCWAIDMDPDLLRKKVIDILEGRAEFAALNAARDDEVDVARKMWRDQAEKARIAHEQRLEQQKIVKERRLNAVDTSLLQLDPAVKGKPRTPHKAPMPLLPHSKTLSYAHRELLGKLDHGIVAALRDGHTTVRAMNIVLEGEFDTNRLRERLKLMAEHGLVEKDGFDWRLKEREAA